MAKALQESEQEEARRNRSTVSIESSDFQEILPRYLDLYVRVCVSRASKAKLNQRTFLTHIHNDEQRRWSREDKHSLFDWTDSRPWVIPFIYFPFCLVNVIYTYVYMYCYYYFLFAYAQITEIKESLSSDLLSSRSWLRASISHITNIVLFIKYSTRTS